MATNFSPCKGSYVLNQFPSNVMFGMNGFHVSASGAIQGHHGPLVLCFRNKSQGSKSQNRHMPKTSYFAFSAAQNISGQNVLHSKKSHVFLLYLSG